MSDSETLSGLLNVSDTAYLDHLTSLDLGTLLSEPSVLQTQSHHLTSSLTSLTHTSYPTFVSLYSSASGLGSSLSEFSSSLDSLLNDSLPALESSVSNWNTETASVLATRRKTLTVLEAHDKLRDLLDIPLLINTCVRNSYFSEALSLASHARGLISAYPSPPLILTSVLAEVDVAMNHMLVSLLTTLHEPNRKLPALWKAVSFLRKMEEFKGEEELALAFLSGRELCLKGSLESLRRDIFRITGAEGELSSRDREDLAKYMVNYVALWREGVFDLISQYHGIFLADALDNAKLHALLTTYVSYVLKTHLMPLFAFSSSLSSSSSKPPVASLPIQSLPSLIIPLTYCASAFARVGAEFRSTLARCVNDAVTYIFSHDISLVEQRFILQFERNMQNKKSKEALNSPIAERKALPRSPSTWLMKPEGSITNPLPTSSSVVASHTPPALLTSYPPLAVHANEVIEVLNSLRACAPISTARGYEYLSGLDPSVKDEQGLTDGVGLIKQFERSLAREGQVVFDYVKSVVEAEDSPTSAEGKGKELSREPNVAMAFGQAFFETWVPWGVKAITQGIYGLTEVSSGKEAGEDSKLTRLRKDWQNWAEKAKANVVQNV